MHPMILSDLERCEGLNFWSKFSFRSP